MIEKVGNSFPAVEMTLTRFDLRDRRARKMPFISFAVKPNVHPFEASRLPRGTIECDPERVDPPLIEFVDHAGDDRDLQFA
jgi:hypothetical protein